MRSILKNWKTTLAGVAIIVVKILTAHGHIGANDAALIAGGIGLIASKDGNVSHTKD